MVTHSFNPGSSGSYDVTITDDDGAVTSRLGFPSLSDAIVWVTLQSIELAERPSEAAGNVG